MDERAALRALLRSDLVAFTQRTFQTVVPGQTFMPNWHIEAMAYHLEGCLCREVRRLIITVPPRNLKSLCASVAFPAWALGKDPTLRFVAASYSQELAAKHSRDCRTVLESPWYKALFPGTRIDAGKNTEGEIEMTRKGYRLATSVGGTLTGRGGNFILIDDPMKPSERMSEAKRAAVAEWYDSTLSSRLDNKSEDVIVLIMQRLHVDDLVGHVLEKDEDWVHLDLPAIAEVEEEIPLGRGRAHRRRVGDVLHPEREPMDELMRLKATMGSQAFSAQYQQAPVPAGGALIQADWLRTYDQVPPLGECDRVVQSWDTASQAGPTNDFSVCTTWLVKGREYYLLDVLRQRLEYPELRRAVLRQAARFQAKSILIEDAVSGAPLVQDLRREGRVRPIPIRPDGDKVVRLEAQSALFEAGHVLLPQAALWLDDFRDELLAFPIVRHDDQVDSTSQFLAWAERHQIGTAREPQIYFFGRRGRAGSRLWRP